MIDIVVLDYEAISPLTCETFVVFAKIDVPQHLFVLTVDEFKRAYPNHEH